MASKLISRVGSLLERGERISVEDCRQLFEERNLLELARLANIPRGRRFGRSAHYCAAHSVVYRGEHPEFFISEAVTSSPEGAVYIAVRCRQRGADVVSVWCERLTAFAKAELPVVCYFAPSDILAIAAIEHAPVGRIIGELRNACSIVVAAEGIGDGAAEDSESALTPESWMSVHRAAHVLGVGTIASFGYGAVDNPDEYAARLNEIRSLQDETGGFTSVLPLALHRRELATHLTAPTAAQSMRVTAIARIFLDNIAHVAAAPALVTTEVAIVALSHGADVIDDMARLADASEAAPVVEATDPLAVFDEEPEPGRMALIRQRIEEARWTPQPVDALMRTIDIPAGEHSW